MVARKPRLKAKPKSKPKAEPKTKKFSYKAKGGARLSWEGKKPVDQVKSFPPQLMQTCGPVTKDKWNNMIFHGDNMEVLGSLLSNGLGGKINLVCIDPPFDSEADYVRKVKLRPSKSVGKMEALTAETYSIGEQIQYTDIWAHDAYLQFMYERLQLLYQLLDKDGTLLIHLSPERVHELKIMLDEIFGQANFRDEIIWVGGRTGGAHTSVPMAYNNILRYTKSSTPTFKMPTNDYTPEEIASYHKDPEQGRSHGHTHSTSENCIYYTRGAAQRETTEEEGDYYLRTYIDNPKTGEILVAKGGPGKSIASLWNDVGSYSLGKEKVGYPTQKPEALYERLINMSSNKGDIILDCFLGSGTTVAVAEKLERRWIGCDINKGAIQTTIKRIQKIKPLKHGFVVFKINDYDLQLLKKEAAELVITHLGITRTRTNPFFDGVRGKKLVKIIDLDHPLTVVDLELIKDWQRKNPNVQEDISIVCLGKVLTVDPLISVHNKLQPYGKLDVIDLRTDEKYGKFLIRTPPEVKIKIKRKSGKVNIKIENYLSKSIIERLDRRTGNKVKLADFRCMIDSVMIDTDYDGEKFNITYCDAPAKNDLVKGEYEYDISKKKHTIAVIITDMLGEDRLITKEV